MLGLRRATKGAAFTVAVAAFACASPAAATLDVPTRVADINPGPGNSFIDQPVPLGANLVFDAFDGSDGELWRTDGSADGTVQVADINPAGSSSAGSFTRLGDAVLFSAFNATGDELWRTDGTSAGTFQLRDIEPGPGSSSPRTLHVVGDRILFRANDGVTGSELWGSDGTAGGTQQVRDINDGPMSSIGGFFFPDTLDGISYFRATEPSTGSELWRSDGTRPARTSSTTTSGAAPVSTPSTSRPRAG